MYLKLASGLNNFNADSNALSSICCVTPLSFGRRQISLMPRLLSSCSQTFARRASDVVLPPLKTGAICAGERSVTLLRAKFSPYLPTANINSAYNSSSREAIFHSIHIDSNFQYMVDMLCMFHTSILNNYIKHTLKAAIAVHYISWQH
jgi:hypothetical protein